ncbi:MAG TPA: YciI family protein [Candidatus Dietzia intestinipullorum]|nr:YciI family protein [Candidatus Dietzia merdigallinarum]HJC28742.1 YciI family protein [Candidatus Dietzia intestinipullorum]
MKYMLVMRQKSTAQDTSADTDMESMINAMGKFNEAMMSAGVLAAGEGLADASEGFVVDYDGEEPVITDGPYGEIHELFNGFWILDVSSKDEAAEWARRAPMGPGVVLEVRRVTDESDFEEFADNEYIQKEKGWREELGTA